MGEQAGKLGLGWMLRASCAVLRSLDLEGWVCWPCACCHLPAYLAHCIQFSVPGRNPHSDYTPLWAGTTLVLFTIVSLLLIGCPAHSRYSIYLGSGYMYVSLYLWVMGSHGKFTGHGSLIEEGKSSLVCSMN